MTTPRTLTELFFQAMDRERDRPVVMRSRRNGAWTDLGAHALVDLVHDATLGFRELGLAPGDHIAILSENRPAWAVADLACLSARCVDVPVYPTLPAGQIEYMLRDSGAVAVCVSTRSQLAKVTAIRQRLPALRHVIAFDAGLAADGVLDWDALLARGRQARPRYPAWREEALQAQPDDLATIIYTSGTTGDPKGVMLTHGNITFDVLASLQVLGVRGQDECLSFLPLSHIFERMAGHYIMLWTGVIINYARGVESVSADLLDRRPTVLTSVPRLYEKMYDRVCDAATASPAKARIFRWARRVGDAWTTVRLQGRRPSPWLGLQRAVADRLVFTKIRDRTGGRIRFFISGGAPLAPDLARFFYAAGMPILEGYGLTETSPVISVNALESPRPGSVGRPIPGVEVRIAEDGEILTRGPHVMRGYYNKPEATAEVIDPDGWFHTGDIGRLDDEGYLYITDRKKDLIVTAGGKNIAPQPIEALLRGSPLIANAIMLGDRRKFPIALLVPDFERLRAWATGEGLPAEPDEALATRREVQAMMELEAKKVLRDLAQFEMPKKFLVLPRDLTVESGELTPKLSVRRRVVEERFREEIDALYNDSAELRRIAGR